MLTFEHYHNGVYDAKSTKRQRRVCPCCWSPMSNQNDETVMNARRCFGCNIYCCSKCIAKTMLHLDPDTDDYGLLCNHCREYN